jgi:cell surface hyaluronidase
MSHSSHRVRSALATLAITVLVLSLIACGVAEAPAAYLPTPPGGPATSPAPPSPTRAWSDASGWPGGAVPSAGDVVTIAHGDVVLLDVSPPPLGGMTVMGDLVFDRRDLALRAGWIMVHGGLYVGSAAEPFTHEAIITLEGAPGSDDVHGMGTSVLGVMDGVLALHGAAIGPSWTRLTSHARAGDTIVSVEDATGWAVGDTVVVASTDFEGWEGPPGSLEARDRYVEARVLVAVEGTRLTLDRPLDVGRVGEAEVVSGVRVDARAEVVRLTRRVVIQGAEASVDAASGHFGFGGHVMAMGDSSVHLHGVELRRMGQLGAMGRYPVHWHLMGDRGAQSAMTRSSIHGSFNRCVTIHGTNGCGWRTWSRTTRSVTASSSRTASSAATCCTATSR